MSKTNIPPARGGSIFEVTLLHKGVNPRTATPADYTIVRVRAANAINASLKARNEHDAAIAFDARKISPTEANHG
jgi:hypothetical protein